MERREPEPEVEEISPVDQTLADEDSSSDGEFEFSVNTAPLTGDPADEIFANGHILPVYPVFNRSLLHSDPDPDPTEPMRSLFLSDQVQLRSGSASSCSSVDSVEVPSAEGTYCAWTPRSSSAGSGSRPGSERNSKWWSVKGLVGGRRSHSDGKEKFVFLNSDSGLKEKAGTVLKGKAGTGKSSKKVKEMDLVTAHKLFYGNKEREGGGEKGGNKRSFLPYKPEVGLFAYGRAHHHHPF